MAAIGFSCRSLLEAQTKAGLRVVAVDNFGDQDATDLADAILIHPGWLISKGAPARNADRSGAAQSIVHWLKSLSIQENTCGYIPVFLAGGTETWLTLLDQLHHHFAVIGPTRSQIGALRDLEFWKFIAHNSEIGFPETFRTAHEAIRFSVGDWLRKPLSGSGGVHIRRCELGQPHAPKFAGSDHPGAESRGGAEDQDIFFQRVISGRSLGVSWTLGKRFPSGHSQILGATESLTSQDWFGPTEFIYRGSLGPLPLTSSQKCQLQSLGDDVFTQTGLEGWLQADFIEDDQRQLWLLELNPRWTAGMEVLWLTDSTPFDDLFLASVNTSEKMPVRDGWKRSNSKAETTRYAGKAIVYAKRDFLLTQPRLQFIHSLPRESFADLPSSRLLGQTIAAGSPLLTVRAVLAVEDVQASTWQDIRQRLLAELRRLQDQFEEAMMRLADKNLPSLSE